MLLYLTRKPPQVVEGPMDTVCSPRARMEIFGCLLTRLGQQVLISQQNLTEIQKSPQLIHTNFSWNPGSQQSTSITFCAAELGWVWGSLKWHRMPTGCPREGSSDGKERQSCAQTDSVLAQGWSEAPPGHSCRVSSWSCKNHVPKQVHQKCLPLVGSFMAPTGPQHLWCSSCHCQPLNIARAVNGQKMTSPPKHSSGCTFPPHFKAWTSYPYKEKFWWGCFLAKLPTSTWPFHTPFVRSNLTVLLR